MNTVLTLNTNLNSSVTLFNKAVLLRLSQFMFKDRITTKLTATVLALCVFQDDGKDFTFEMVLCGLESLSAAITGEALPGCLPVHPLAHLRVSYSEQFLQVKERIRE